MTFLQTILLSIGIGIATAIVKIMIEYDYYAKVKNEALFHGIGGAAVVIIYAAVWFFFGWKAAQIFILAYWNIFELGNNYFHNQELLYVGREAAFDKFIRKHFRYKRAKLFLHIITLILILLIIFL